MKDFSVEKMSKWVFNRETWLTNVTEMFPTIKEEESIIKDRNIWTHGREMTTSHLYYGFVAM